MREGVRRGMTVPSVIMQRYNEPLEAQIVDDPEKSLLYAPLREFPEAVPESEHERLRAAARKAIAESVVPGYRQFLKFMKDEYVPNCRGTIAASALPNGRDYYRFCVAKFTTLDDRTPEEVHAIGKAEVARIRGEMDKIIRDVEVRRRLRHVHRVLADRSEVLRQDARGTGEGSGVHPEADGRPVAEAVWPLAADAVRRPAGARLHRAAGDVRVLPAADGRRPPGRLLLHQHVQPAEPAAVHARSAVAARGGARPPFADRTAAGAGDICRSFASTRGFTAFVEGWALYSERLGLEAGFYKDPYSDFGRLTMEIWRACRLVVDTGIHYLGWTREQAIEYMRANSAMPMHDIRAEVDRYIGWPGQALAYKSAS